MQFVSFKADPILDYIEFYRNKFPIAFKLAPEDEDEENEASDWVWESAAYEKRFENFEEEMDKVTKKRSALSLL